MSMNPEEIGNRINTISKAWKNGLDTGSIPADQKFKGYLYADYVAKVKPSLDARQKLAELELEMTQWIDQRNDADKISLKANQDVLAGVAGDSDFGDDSVLYEEMGRVRKSERKSGLTRKKKTDSVK